PPPHPPLGGGGGGGRAPRRAPAPPRGGGRLARHAADAVFARRREEAEDAPDDWRAWFRLAVAYQDARDTPRARKAMQRAIALHRSRLSGV
ncbi:hypothetical protein ACFV00_34175, partial [Streptomyces californicus]